MKNFKILFAVALILNCEIASVMSQNLEEFNGPYNSWINVKERFGAKGDNNTDDTHALQLAIESLGCSSEKKQQNNCFTVLYLPAGTYCISKSLLIKGKMGISIIGESPETTKIKWIGKDNDTMFLANGSAYYKVSRISWLNNGRKGLEAIGIHWLRRDNNFASLNIEISDSKFLGGFKYGINGGTTRESGTGHNDSEITIKRCEFIECTDAGINIRGYNALDYWIWDCRFIKCNIGVNSGLGNFHVYRSYFERSTISDVKHSGGYYTSVRGCYSEGSKMLSSDEGSSSNPFKRVFQSNIILKSSDIPIRYYHLGKITAIDNYFGVPADTAVHAAISTGTWAAGAYEVMSYDNSFPYKDPITFSKTPNRVYFYPGISSKKLKEKKAFLSQMERLPSLTKRQVFEVPPNANEQIIQIIINKASKSKSELPIVHFPPGTYVLNNPLHIPKGASIQLIGDGFIYSSVILSSQSFPKGESMLKGDGKSTIIIKEMQWGNFTDMTPSINGFQFDHADQQDSQIFLDQLYSNSKNSILANEVDYLYIQKDNSFFSYGCHISGGSMRKQGKGTSGIYSYGGQFAGGSVDNGSVFVAKDCWWEGPQRQPLIFTGSGNFTIDGAMVAPQNADSNATIIIDNFSGKISLLNMYIQGGILMEQDNPNLKLLFWNLHFYHVLAPLKFISAKTSLPGAFMGITTQCITGAKICENIMTIPNHITNIVDTNAFVPKMLNDDRNSAPRKYIVKSSKATNIYISRVSMGDFKIALYFSK